MSTPTRTSPAGEDDPLPPGVKERPVRKFGRRYPWDRWFRRPKFTLYRGLDYSCRTDSMALMARFAGWDRGKRCTIKIHEDGAALTVTVSPAPEGHNPGAARRAGRAAR